LNIANLSIVEYLLEVLIDSRLSEDQVVVDGVLIGGRVRLSIGFVVVGCLTTASNVCAEFLRSDRHRAPLLLFLSRVLKIVVFSGHE
jgi:hypothetical protein